MPDREVVFNRAQPFFVGLIDLLRWPSWLLCVSWI